MALVNRGKIHDLLGELPPERQPRLRLSASVTDAVRALVRGEVTGAGVTSMVDGGATPIACMCHVGGSV